jgi:hypothetical protein
LQLTGLSPGGYAAPKADSGYDKINAWGRTARQLKSPLCSGLEMRDIEIKDKGKLKTVLK